MNKVYAGLITVFALCNFIAVSAQEEALLPLSAKEEQRVSAIVYLYSNKALEHIRYELEGDIDALNEDIALVEKHAVIKAYDKKAAEKGDMYAKALSGIQKALGFGSGIISVGAGLMSGTMIRSLYRLFSSPDVIVKMEDGSLYFSGSIPNNLQFDANLLRGFIPMGVPFCLGAALLFGLVSKAFFNASHKDQLLIEKLQKEYEQDIIIIAALKKIRYELTHS
jgi:hypothetical protein